MVLHRRSTFHERLCFEAHALSNWIHQQTAVLTEGVSESPPLRTKEIPCAFDLLLKAETLERVLQCLDRAIAFKLVDCVGLPQSAALFPRFGGSIA